MHIRIIREILKNSVVREAVDGEEDVVNVVLPGIKQRTGLLLQDVQHIFADRRAPPFTFAGQGDGLIALAQFDQ